jgi:trigger factor
LKAEVTEVESWKKKLEVNVDPEEFKPYVEKAYKNYQKKIKIDGFRKGKVPISVIRKRFESEIQAEISEDLAKIFFEKVVKEKKLPIVAPGLIKEIDFEEGKTFRFIADVEVEPEVEISNYKGLKLTREIRKITQDDIHNTIQTIRTQRAKIEISNTGVEAGGIVEGDIQALNYSGIPIVGQKWENTAIELGSPPLGEKIQDQLIGVMAGEERKFKFNQPVKDEKGETRDQEYNYLMKVKSVKKKILPELNDQFAQTVGNYQTISEFEKDVELNLQVQMEEESKKQLHYKITDEIIKRNNFELPPSMIENALDSLWKEYQNRPNQEINEQEYKEQNRAMVIWNLKWNMMLYKIAEIEEIEISDDVIEQEIDKVAKSNPKETEKIRMLFKAEKHKMRLKERLLEEKVYQFLEDNSKIKDVIIKKSKSSKSSLIIPGT